MLEAVTMNPESIPDAAPAAAADFVPDEERTEPQISTAGLATARLEPQEPAGSSDDEARMVWSTFASSEDKFAAGPQTVTALEEIIQKDAGCASARYFLGQVYFFVGDELNARVWFNKTLEVDPEHGAARQRLAAMGA
jgi:hypothetical protein